MATLRHISLRRTQPGAQEFRDAVVNPEAGRVGRVGSACPPDP